MLGILPGFMGDAGYLVRSKGEASSLQSASHGAGRQFNSETALSTITKTAWDAYLKEHGIILLGGGLDESPQAHKDIKKVMSAQQNLVAIMGKFTPQIVRTADDAKNSSRNMPK